MEYSTELIPFNHLCAMIYSIPPTRANKHGNLCSLCGGDKTGAFGQLGIFVLRKGKMCRKKERDFMVFGKNRRLMGDFSPKKSKKRLNRCFFLLLLPNSVHNLKVFENRPDAKKR